MILDKSKGLFLSFHEKFHEYKWLPVKKNISIIPNLGDFYSFQTIKGLSWPLSAVEGKIFSYSDVGDFMMVTI